MSDLHKDLPSSDDSDEDFVLDGEEQQLSEEDSNGDESDDAKDNADEGAVSKRSKQKKNGKKRRKVEENEESSDQDDKDTKKAEEPQKSTDELWAAFVSGPSEPKKSEEQGASSSSTPEIKTVTEVCTFAGEKVTVEKQVPVSTPNSRGRGRGRGGGGLTGILGSLGKQTKLSVLEKSKLDWNQFKQKEGLEEELSKFNKGKDGYLEKQDFLQRADLRQFEQEKELRNATRKTLR
uniref:Craniofacial development protein 1 n=1 Tax=Cacopsylla melanoneura TaxID=428564 RepID=A0A8D8XU95_9HEMI